MNLKAYLLDKKIYFIGHGMSLLLLSIFLSVVNLNLSSIIFILMFMLFGHVAYLIHDYFRRFKYYVNLLRDFNQLDKKYLITELTEAPNFYEGALLESLLKETNKCMNDELAVHRLALKNYQEYVETWVHEIKTPIAAAHLLIENNSSLVNNQVKQEITKVEDYVEQALYYAKSQHVEKDYIIKRVKLDDLIHETLRKYSKLLISKKCEINIEFQDVCVYTDYKWTVFILGQIVKNSIQYSQVPMSLAFKVKELNHQVILEVKDKGIGIPQSELKKVFQKGFVGSTGRLQSRSTGIGLYLCKQLAMKMGLQIELESKVDTGTTVRINFPIHDFLAG